MRLFGKKLSRKYGLSTIEADEGDRLHAAIVAAWQSEAVETLCELLDESDKQRFYSNYPWYRAWEYEQKPQIVQFLFRRLPFEQFLRFPCKQTIYKSAVVMGLNAIADEVSDWQIRQLSETFTFPHFNSSPQLFARIVASPEAATTAWLQVWIDERIPAEQERGRSLSAHQKTVSTFHLRWSTPDKGLSVAVYALAQRADDEARELTRNYLLSLPWGQDRGATELLLSGLLQRQGDAALPLIEAALTVQIEVSAGRLLLLSHLIKLAPERALQLFLRDCALLEDPIAIEAYLEWWQSHREILEPFAPQTRDLAEALDVRNWPLLLRGQAAALWYPAWPSAPSGGALNRAFRALINAFEACRVEHLGCGIVLPLAMVLGYGWLAFLRFWMGPAKAELRPFVTGCLVLWIFALAVTSHTHFSGHEKLKDKLWLSLFFFGSLLLFLGLSLAAHL